MRHTPPLHIRATVAALLLAGTGAASSADDAALDGSRTVCTHAEATLPRVIEVLYDDPATPVPCRVLYEKDGSVEEIAAARNSGGHCEKIERKVVRNLAAGGYECRHTFTGALASASADRAIALDLFADAADDPSSRPDETIVAGGASREPDPDGDRSTSPDPETLAHEHVYSHSHPLDGAGSASIEHTHVAMLDPDSPPSPSVADVAEPSARVGDGRGGRAVLSRALPGQSEAHRFAAEFRRSFPNVRTRVAEQGNTGDRWHVALGVGDDDATLERALEPLGPDARALFGIVALDAASRENGLRFVEDDWARYAIAGCYAEGRRTAVELADCANVVVDAESFVNCLGGGLCAPARFREGMDVDAIDLASVLGADDPIAAARERVTARVEGCERLADPDDAAFVECAALAVMDDDHRLVYDCYQRSASELALLECAGGDAIADHARAYDRCGASGYEAVSCLLEGSDNDHLESAAYCLAHEDAAEVASCSLDASLSDDDALVLACLTDYTARDERAACLARERLSDSGYAAVQCAGLADDVADYGLCVGERDGSLSSETLHAVRCLRGNEIATDTLLDCAGGQFVDEDIRRCVEHGLGDTRCFDARTLMSEVANDAVDDYLQLASLDNEITRFRQELYALEGGDLGEILAAEGGAGLTSVQDEVKTRTKGGLRGLLGF